MAVRPQMHQVLSTYDGFHQNSKNIICHFIGIPVITFATLGLFSQLQLAPYVDGGLILFGLNAAYFLSKDWKITLPFLILNFGVYLVARQVPLVPHVVLFGLGWGTAILGHKVFEKNQPAVFTNLKEAFLGVGPMYMFAKLVGAYRSDSKDGAEG